MIKFRTVFDWNIEIWIYSILDHTNIAFQRKADLTTEETDSYSEAANVAEEVLSGIRTVYAFGGEQLEINRYNDRLENAKNVVKQKGLLTGIEDGVLRFLFLACSAVTFWYGVQLVLDDRDKEDKEHTPAVLMIVYFILSIPLSGIWILILILLVQTFLGFGIGINNVENTAPLLEAFSTACASAASIFRVIERKSEIDSMSNEGNIPDSDINGNITFRNVQFSYPARSDVEVKINTLWKISFRSSEIFCF